MSLPDRHSLLWKLVAALALLCLLVVILEEDLAERVENATSRLPEETQQVLKGYAAQAQRAWEQQGAAGVDAFLEQLQEHEQVWAVVVSAQRESLASQPLSEDEHTRLNFIRPIDGLIGRPGARPSFYIPFDGSDARLVMELPLRLNPRQHNRLWEILAQQVLPASLAVLLGALLYRMLIAPMASLRRQAIALGSGDLSARIEPQIAERRDELGELARTVNHMAARLESTVDFQRRLLRALSHELRTPLSRLRVAGERELDIATLRQRQEREVLAMERLIDDTLELVWLDTERPRLPAESVEVAELWNILREDCCFETGWPVERLPCELPADCRVSGNLNGLAQVLENILRNAVRHSPEHGIVRLSGQREDAHWHLWIEDQGPGVAPEQLQQIFKPFTRLSADRPGGDGFGLGLSIAQSVVHSQSGDIWADNAHPGLRVHVRLPAA
ncbi:sensor histidine kinase [Pseudomonas sp. 21LCFQ010]|uniref:HAMP domain-containing sensor histidine kinase n=1 Tax=Pseudomonas sp. 21LCFQ010 TaxID=2957506 RepID=UPI002096953C|nr:sensor histidine kinase [Pseudomonas sp. 21LCFQ010]MCO8165424.1 sensor histidine kinase [Pseudomonas sp. 21LCFQ010]